MPVGIRKEILYMARIHIIRNQRFGACPVSGRSMVFADPFSSIGIFPILHMFSCFKLSFCSIWCTEDGVNHICHCSLNRVADPEKHIRI
jgi:hypothetical protein